MDGFGFMIDVFEMLISEGKSSLVDNQEGYDIKKIQRTCARYQSEKSMHKSSYISVNDILVLCISLFLTQYGTRHRRALAGPCRHSSQTSASGEFRR